METSLVQALSHLQAHPDFHGAHMKGDGGSLGILKPVTDTLGRTHPELRPEGLEGFGSDIDLGAEVAVELDAEMYTDAGGIDEQVALVEPFSTLHLEDNDSGHSQSDSEDHAPRLPTTTRTDGCQLIHRR